MDYGCSRLPMMAVSATAYLLSLVGIVLMFVWFAPRVTCGLNIFFITWTLILIIGMTAISLHSKVWPDVPLPVVSCFLPCIEK